VLDRDGRVAWAELIEEGLEVLRAPQRRLASAAHRRAVLDDDRGAVHRRRVLPPHGQLA
jgi:hypothetical protein